MGTDDDVRIARLQQLLESLEASCKQAEILRLELQRRLTEARRRDLPIRSPPATERRRKLRR